MTKEFGIVRGYDYRRSIHIGAKRVNLLLAFIDKILSVLMRFFQRFFGIVNFLGQILAGYAIVFDSCIDADFTIEDIGSDIIKIKIETDVTVVFAVIEIARIAFLRTPNLPG